MPGIKSLAISLLMLALCPALGYSLPTWEGFFPTAQELAGQVAEGGALLVHGGEEQPVETRFTIPLPDQKWVRLPPASEKAMEGLTSMGRFVAPDTSYPAMISVSTMTVREEMGEREWLETFLEATGRKVLVSRPANGEGGRYFEALAVRAAPKAPAKAGQKEEDFYCRAALYRSGQQMFLVECLAPQTSFASHAKAFALATIFFKPDQVLPETLVGNWGKACLGSPGVCFTLPTGEAEWVFLQRQIANEVVFTLKQGQRVTGSLGIRLAQGSDGQVFKRLDGLLKELAGDKGEQFWKGRLTEITHQVFNGPALYYHGQGSGPQCDTRVYVLSLSSEAGSLLCWVVSDGRDCDTYNWIRNKRLFDIVSNSLAPGGSK